MLKNNIKKEVLKNLVNLKNIIIYIISFMISTINLGQEVSPFSIAIVGASLANGVPAIGIVIAGLVGNILGAGVVGALNYVLIILMLMIILCVKPPRESDEYKNEQIQISSHIFISIILVMIAKLILTKFTIGDLLLHIMLAVLSVVFYKIFVNSLVVIQEFTEKRAFSIEEVIGANLLLAIAISAIGDFGVLGLSIRNILSILIVLILGWKNGILIGATSGITIGVTLGIISQGEPIIIAVYALSGMIAGILNRFGKIGVIVGFIIGNIILIYASNGMTTDLILFKEVLIASLGLLAMPKWIGIKIENIENSEKLLPEYYSRGLEQSKETINKLNMVSEAIKDMADTYEEKNINNQEMFIKNRNKFISELLNNLDNLKENMLYDDMTEEKSPITYDLFDKLLEKQEITSDDIVRTFRKYNNYIVEFKEEKAENKIKQDIELIVKAVNDAYKTSKTEFIWEEKIKTSKKNVQAQLNGVSKAISNIAVEIEENIKEKPEYEEEKKKIISSLEIKNILVEDIEISIKEKRFFIDIYIKDESQTSETKDIEKIEKSLEKIMNEKFILNETRTRKLQRQKKRVFCYMSADKYIIQIGQASSIKKDEVVSGDSTLQVRLNDGKYLLAISDGMGAGPEARKSSQIAIKMLERLLMTGFDKDTSIDLINTTIMNANEEIFATLDIAIADLYNGKIEFIKNGACPTYVKNKKKVQIVKSLSLPAGILKDINITTYDKDIVDQDIMVMCSDGIIDSNVEYKNKELWLKYMLEDIETDNSQKIADIILNESIDNNYGISKDDMSVIVCKFIENE